MAEAPIRDNQPSAPDPAETGSTEVPAVPDEHELERVAEPATVRRAPKFGAFIAVGALGGAVVGLTLALIATHGVDGSASTGSDAAFISLLAGDGAARFISLLAGAGCGALLAAGVALWADRRSARHR